MKAPRKRVKPAELDYVRERLAKLAEKLDSATKKGQEAAGRSPGIVGNIDHTNAYLVGWLGSEAAHAAIEIRALLEVLS